MNQLLSAFLLLVSLPALGQVTTGINTETQKLYLVALEKYIDEFDIYKAKGIGIIKPDTIFLVQSHFLEDVPKEYNEVKLFEITGENWERILKKNRNGMTWTNFEPIEVDSSGSEIFITLTHTGRVFERKFRVGDNLFFWKKILMTSYGDWFLVYFKFNTEKKEWEFSRTELTGI